MAKVFFDFSFNQYKSLKNLNKKITNIISSIKENKNKIRF